MNSPVKPLPIAVLISGGGTTLKNILELVKLGRLDVDVRMVISSAPTASGLCYAAEADIPAVVVERNSHDTPESFRDAIFNPIREHGAELVVMAGFLKHVLIPDDFENRVINIHPALIPAFCGKGYYGSRVHAAVIEYGAKISGCTVHFADNQYDHGPIILQRTVEVLEDDTPSDLAARIFEAECKAYPEAIQLLTEGRVKLEGRRVRITE